MNTPPSSVRRMQSLVVGYGSIGQRHARLLTELGASPAVVSRRTVDHPLRFANLAQALEQHRPELIVIASETAQHHDDLTILGKLGFEGRVLVEKPLFERPLPLPPNAFRDLRVGYNLRCHALIGSLRQRLGARRVCLAQGVVGQYLPHWRPGRDWRAGYSADRARGGGALRDLSHELDLLLWLLGDWQRVAALGGRSGLLPIASDDHWCILLAFKNGACAMLQLDYLSRPGRRMLAAEHEEGTLIADLLGKTLSDNGAVEHIDVERDDSYRRQLQAMLSGETQGLCDAAAGLAVVDLIDAIERAAQSRTWVSA